MSRALRKRFHLSAECSKLTLMRVGYPLWLWFVILAVALSGCAGPTYRYGSLNEFAPNSPRPLPNPRPKPTPPRAAQPASAPASVTVRRGETVYALSRRYGRSPRAIIEANGLKPPYTVYPGQKLRLPGVTYHTVHKGETGYGISRRYGVEVTELMRINKIRAPYVLKVGQKLQIPAGGKVGRTRQLASGSGARATPRAVPAPPKRSAGSFAWPVQGRLVSRFGPKKGGLHNDGINIAAPKGAPVRAAENGVVAYAGKELRGFGNLLLIRHDGGWVTAYGHNDTLLVKRGDTVRRGQTIARVGSTGSVESDQLHFEIRRGTRAVDPQRHL